MNTSLIKAHITTIDKTYIRTSVDIARPASETIVLRGRFKHQGMVSDFAVYTAVSADKPITHDGQLACLSAMASVISSQPMEQPQRVEVVDGDIIDVDGKLYEIRDDRALSDPRLVEIGEAPTEVEVNLFDQAIEAGAATDEEISPGRVTINGTQVNVYFDAHYVTDNSTGEVKGFYGVDIRNDQLDYHCADLLGPETPIDVMAGLRNALAMLCEEVNQSTGNWPPEVVTWAVHNSGEIADVVHAIDAM